MLLAQMYKETLKGESNTGKWLITAGGTKVTPLQISAQTMQWLESTEYFQKLIFAMFKISPTQLGFTEQVNL
jgi:phage portal protein BeeE